MVVDARVENGREFARVRHLWHDRAFESADFGLERVAAVEEDHVVARFRLFFDEFVQLGGRQLRSAAANAGLTDA